MRKCLPTLLATAVTLFAAPDASAQTVMACAGRGGIGSFPLLNAKDALLGRTVQVHFFTEESLERGAQKLEPEPLVRRFGATSLEESLGTDSVMNDITYEGPYWCRFDELTASRQCYGILVGWPDGSGQMQYFEVRAEDPSGFCKVQILAVIRGAKIPEGGAPQATHGGRRAPRG